MVWGDVRLGMLRQRSAAKATTSNLMADQPGVEEWNTERRRAHASCRSPLSQNYTHVLVEGSAIFMSSISKLAITLAVKTNRQHLNCTSSALLSECSSGIYN